MAESSFWKHYYVPEEMADEFVEIMTKEAPPTLTADFQSHFKHVWEIEHLLNKALNGGNKHGKKENNTTI